MAKNKNAGKNGDRKRQLPLVWIALALVVLVGAAIYFFGIRSQVAFQLQEGQQDLLVLIRNQNEGTYQVLYQGREPVQLDSLKVILGGQILHIDVVQVTVQYQGQEVVLNQPGGELPSGEPITIQPGDSFTTKIIFRGQSLGGNYFKGFRVGYSTDGQSTTYDMEVGDDYAIVVQ